MHTVVRFLFGQLREVETSELGRVNNMLLVLPLALR
ncbi:hypothetical protein L612_006200000040 [Rhodococcus rhodochrous J38]|jgi:hypothetical protein|nr:hypothetical protein L612_006200000040 [Rhodococcus rhodochrous J38]